MLIAGLELRFFSPLNRSACSMIKSVFSSRESSYQRHTVGHLPLFLRGEKADEPKQAKIALISHYCCSSLKTIKVVLMAGSCEVTRRSDNTIQTLMCWKRMSKVRSHDQIHAKRRSKLGSTLSLVLSSRFINSNKPKVRRHTILIPCRVSAAFAPYRVRPYLIPCSSPHFSSSTPSSRVRPLIEGYPDEWMK